MYAGVQDLDPKVLVRGISDELSQYTLVSEEGVGFTVSFWLSTNSSIIFHATPCQPDEETAGKWVFKAMLPLLKTNEVELNHILSDRDGLAVGRYFWHGPVGFLYGKEMEGYFMRKFENRDLFSCLDESLSPGEIRNLFMGVGRGIWNLHRLGMIHNDIKLENVFVDGHFNGFLADFGYVQETELTDMVHATWQYMAPEMARALLGIGPRAFDQKADIWSMGYCLYIMLTGSYMFAGSAKKDCNYEFLNDLARRSDDDLESDIRDSLGEIDEIDDVCIDFVCRCMKVNPNDRMSAEDCLCHEYMRLVCATKAVRLSLPDDDSYAGL